MTSNLASFAAQLRERVSQEPTADISDDEFNCLALELFALQFNQNVSYRKICEARRVKPAAVQHWSRIPAVPTTVFKEFELTSLAPPERTVVFHSSGTTEQRPSRHFHSDDSLALYEAGLWPWFERHVLAASAIGDRQLAILTPPACDAPNSSLIHMFETIRRRTAAPESAFLGSRDNTGAWTLDFSRAGNALRSAVAANVPLILLGTAFNFVHLLDWLTERNLHFELPPGSVVMETGGYKGRSRELAKSEFHRLVTEQIGVPSPQIICEYGMSELSSQAYDGVAGDERISCHSTPITRHFRFPPWARVQIISPETGAEVAEGETGLIRIFDLANAFSVLAVQTEDLAIRRGDGFELLGRAVTAEARGCSLMATELHSS